MLFKCRSSSISTVHFKRQLPFPPTSPISNKTISNASKQTDPSYLTSRPLSRLRALLSVPDSTQFHEPHSAHSLCSNALKISAKMGFICEGKQLHGHVVKLGLYNLYLQNQILNVYVRCKELHNAHKVFGEMTVRSVVAWNTVISGVVDERSKCKSSSLLGFVYFKRMLLEMGRPDDITFNILLRSCIVLHDVQTGLQLHCFIVKLGFGSNCFVGTAIVDWYAKCGFVEDARHAFDYVLFKDLVLWNVMVYCYASNCFTNGAIQVFNFMQSENVKGDEFTFSSLINLCGTPGSCQLGKQIHGIVIRKSFDLDVLVATALIDMYSKNENIVDARKVFDTMAIRNRVSWNTMIVGYGQHGDSKKAIKLFRQMLQDGFSQDELTLSSIFSSCSNAGVSTELMQIHALSIKFGFHSFLSTVNAMINAYSKCGNIVGAFLCFSLAEERNLFTWTSIICAYAFHGLAEEAMECFEKMLTCGLIPDRITFLGVLSACSHGGLIDKGYQYYEMMTKKYQILPDSEHYTCLVDLVGRAGLLDEALNILSWIPNEAEKNALGAFLGACKIHGNLRLAEWAAEKLFALEPNVPMNYTIMSNIYSSKGCWTDVANIRKMMRRNCDLKSPGFSWVEVAGEVHTFASRDQAHSKAVEVYDMLGLLCWLIKEEVIIAETSKTLLEEYAI
ncbi:pentatricopeptide repeat-containing protein At2g46050, mitochondrial [Humulus lupulus]|uniref:pentatricopeptide repeat-containing protein At2g46050, mitochondrial n=1 Tax=Humulus lupulus TaxID=3486 RepID=UPI002B410807|nr:pentatricopeptide repeat-containing protein At2g46050, mitochondrial [Humulus lupulus]